MASIEKVLSNSEDNLRALFENIPIPTYLWQKLGKSFKLTDYNNAAYDFSQGGVKSYLGIDASEMYKDRKDILEDLNRCLDEKTVITQEISYYFYSLNEEKDLQVKYVFLAPDMVLVHTEDITEYKNVEKKIHYQARLVEDVSDAIISTDLEFNIKTWNRAAEDIYGWKAEEVIGNNLTNLIPVEYPNDDEETVLKKFFEESFWKGEVIQKHKDGNPVNILSSVSLIKDVFGNPTGAVAINRDITDLKSAEQKLIESEDKFSKAFHTSSNMMTITRMDDGSIIDVNEAFAKTLGFDREELLGRSTAGLNLWVNSEDRSEFVRRIQEYGELNPIDVEIYTKSGEILNVFFSGDIIHLNNEPHLIAIASNITKRIKAEHKLRESEEKYRSLFNNMNAGFAYHEVIVDENNKPIDYKYIEANPAFEKLTGLKARDIIGKKVTEILPGTEEDPADWIGKFGNVGLTGIPLTVEDYSEAIDRWYKVSGYSPKKGYFAVTFTDITERKKAEQRVQESEEKYRKLFENSPIALMEQDYSETKRYVDHLKASGIIDFEKFFDDNPEEVLKLMTMNKIIDVNRKSLEVYNANSKEDLFLRMNQLGDNIDKNITDEVLSYNKKEILTLLEGKTIYESEIASKTFTEDTIYLYARTSIMPGFESTWSKVIVSIVNITDRKLMEEKLKESEKKFRTIFDSIPDLYFQVSEDTTVLDYRGSKQELYRAPEEFLGKKVSDLVPPYLALKTVEMVKKTLRTQEPQILEYDLKMKDGVHFYEARYFYFSKNQVFIFIRDITERKNAEKQIVDIAKFPSENPNPVLRVTKENVIYINKSGQTLLHLTESSVVPNFFKEQVINAFKEDMVKTIETNFNSQIYSFNIVPIIHEGYANIYGQDITERKKYENALNMEKKFTEDIFNSSIDTIFVFEPETRKAHRWNKVFNEVSGYSDEEISSMKAPDSFYSEEDLKIASFASKTILNEGKTTVEMSLITKDNKKIPYEYTGTSFKSSDGKNLIVSIGRDMTERNEAEKQFQEAYNRANFYKDIFAHDINNILQIITSSAELISIQLGDSEKSKILRNLTKIINQQVERGGKLVRNVHTLSKLEEENVIVQPIKVDETLRKSIEFVKNSYEDRQLHIQVDSTDLDFIVQANLLLQDVFENILINGVKYNENPNVDILIRISKVQMDNKELIRMEFIDNGIGVLDDRKGIIFKRGNRKLKGDKGMGLGLSLVSKIISSFKGKIWVEDKIKGDHAKGSNFIILLPIKS